MQNNEDKSIDNLELSKIIVKVPNNDIVNKSIKLHTLKLGDINYITKLIKNGDDEDEI